MNVAYPMTLTLEEEKLKRVKEMSKKYRIPIAALVREAVDVIIRNEEQLDKIYLKEE